MSGPVIEAKGLTKRYGTATAVNSVTFEVGAGEIFGLLGPNGAGKTTTILMLLGLSDISAGTARVFGHDPARDPLAVKRYIGYLPDSVGFYDHLSAADNLHYTARLIGIPRAERTRRIAEALTRVGLFPVMDKKVGTFSRGMRQRLGLAEIVMKQARIAILDEPTNGLDPQASLELLDLIRDLKASGVSILLSSHLLDRVQSVCDRVALFNAGSIALMGTVGELGRQVLGGGFTVEVEADGGKDVAKRLRGLAGVRNVVAPEEGRWRLTCERDLRAEAAAEVVAAGGRLKQLSLDQPSLENIYTRYFQDAAKQREEVRDAA
ncbi:MAG TPA: ABC transporter ATP-binding protein [Pseudolabrys sp.]|nr:ABC transporter ATP-binding protein [Pseudolabrys sp.]